MKLNIGAGATVIDGFTPVDRQLGSEAYPLDFADGSVEEIRASHILEHFPQGEVVKVLREWSRVLQPGGKLRVAVPDLDKCVADQANPNWHRYVMGGQTDKNDYHKALFTDGMLREAMTQAGFVGLVPWTSSNTDCASMPISLNIEGRKQELALEMDGQRFPIKKATLQCPQAKVKICGVMSLPRVGWNDAWAAVLKATSPLNIPVHPFGGVFWGQCMQRAFEQCVSKGIDWLLTIDYDSMFTAQHLDHLLGAIGQNPHIDAICALQARRREDTPLMTLADGGREVMVTGAPIKIRTGHFGLTIIRTECLADIPKPWFWSKPDLDGGWGEGRMDDDIWFWHQWGNAGKTLYCDPDCRIGHLQVMESRFNEDMVVEHVMPGARQEGQTE